MKHKKSAIIVIVLTVILSIFLTTSKGNLSQINSEEDLGKTLGIITIIPTLLAVGLAFITNQVVFSLLIGFLLGVLILTIVYSTSVGNLPITFISEAIICVKNVVLDFENIEILLLCFVVGGMVEVIRSSGGFEALAIKLTKKIDTPRKANLIGSLLGCIIFFDDYANALIVGPIMKPITDRVKISREKLSYIVDSTAAPVTGIAIISSWVAVELSSIEKGLQMTNISTSPFSLFIKSVPFTFYCLFALTFIYINAILGRDYGPMLKAEIRARKGEPVSKLSKKIDDKKQIVNDKLAQRIFTGVGAIIILIVLAMVLFYTSGRKVALADGIICANQKIDMSTLIHIIGSADTVRLVSISSLIGTIFAIVTGCIYKLYNLKDAIKSWFIGAKNLFSTVVLLILAWCLANVVGKLGMTYYAVEIISTNIPWQFVPLLIFVCCCIVSFASGSYGCLFVVMPLAIPLAYRIISMGVTNNNEIYLVLCIASVMAGSIFGDHCSPVTDCTILSALGSGCETMEHCKTQMPYALTVGVISMIAILQVSFGFNVLLVYLIAIAIQLLILFTIGKKPEQKGQ